jgi:hypothetical protein
MSRRFKNRHHKIEAQPDALPAPAIVLDDSNSYVNPTQSDCRIPLEPNGRDYRVAETTIAAEKSAAADAAAAAAAAESGGE